MPILRRRRSISSDSVSLPMSRPSTVTAPAVASISRARQRTSVDFPDPDRPITTSISPLWICSETSRTAATCPLRRNSSAVVSILKRPPGLTGWQVEGAVTHRVTGRTVV